jgi:hypothetical protein
VTRKKHTIFALIITILVISLTIPFNLTFTSPGLRDDSRLKSSATEIQQKQWLYNNYFSTQDDWSFVKGSQGDNSSVDGTIENNEANLKVIGQTKVFSDISGTPNSSTSLGWEEFNNDGFLLPDSSGINSEGCYATHTWAEGPNQFPSVHWRKNVSLSDDMSDYTITSVSLNALFNASVNANVDAANDSTSVQYYAIGDFVRFYVQIADIEYKNSYTVALNKTVYLGQNTGTSILSITDTLIESYNDSVLITALNSAFEKDPDHSNFTLTLGIDIYSEDNWQSTDTDTFTLLMIKTCDLSFTYEKKVEKYSSISLKQVTNQINTTYQVMSAVLNFDYKINQLWPTSLSPFSELRILINDNPYAETIRLSSANTTFQEAKSGGFDVSGLIVKGINITFSLQLYLADTFGVGSNLTISIDNIFLNITYSLTVPDYDSKLSLFLNGVNKTLDPFLEIPLGGVINVTVKFSDRLGIHLGGSTVQLQGVGFDDPLNESVGFEQYTIIINSTEKLSMGLNVLTLEAQLTNYQTKIINPQISVREINAEITSLSGSNTINIESGKDVPLSIIINNTDFGGYIKGAVVLLSGDLGTGVLTDPDNDGIYESILQNIPEGSYTIIINAIGSEDYNFISYQLTINAITPTAPDYTWLILVLSGGVVGIVLVFSLYQFHFKYPPMVRKIRKLRKKIKKEKNTKPILLSERNEIVEKNFQSQVSAIGFESELPEKKIKK